TESNRRTPIFRPRIERLLALRMAVQSLHRSESFLGEYFRRVKARLGAPRAITATAHPDSNKGSSYEPQIHLLFHSIADLCFCLLKRAGSFQPGGSSRELCHRPRRCTGGKARWA